MTHTERLLQNHLLKIVILILFIDLLIIYLISRHRATGYEDSIYANIPAIVWILLFLSIICGISLMTIFNKRDSYWLIGLVIILLNNMLILLLPVLKGYVFYGKYDILTHIGLTKDILSYGYFEKENFYPITHVLFSEIALIANIPPMSLFSYMPVFFSMLFILFIHLFAKAILNKKEQVLIATASGGVLLLWGYHTIVVPNGIADFFYPLFMAVFYLRNTKKSFNYNVLLLILVLLFPFLHPLTTVALVFTIIMFKLSFHIIELSNVGHKEIFSKLRQRATVPLLVNLIVFIAWISTFMVWEQTIRDIFTWLLGEVTVTPINAMADTLNRIELTGIGVLELYLKLYGHILIFIILSAVASLIIIKEFFQNRNYEFQKQFSLVVIFIGFILFLFWLLLVPMGFGALRLMSYLAIISIILGSFSLHEFIVVKFNKRRYIAPLAILIILVIPMGIGIFNVFDSPYILKPNLQITNAEMDGYKWAFDHKDPDITVSAVISAQPYRFVDALWGVKARMNRNDVKEYGSGPEATIPDHFNYTNYTTVGSSYSADGYILLSEYDKHLYTEVWKVIGRYNHTDFERISYDPTMLKIYSNGGFDTWIVKSLQ